MSSKIINLTGASHRLPLFIRENILCLGALKKYIAYLKLIMAIYIA